MSNKKTYWAMKNGQKIDIDKMSENHLRNTLKMIVRQLEKEKFQSELDYMGGPDWDQGCRSW